jgi:hypothetical protein
MTRLHRPLLFFFVGIVALSACPVADGQTKFSSWFRERVGERKAKDEAKAKEDATWREKNVASPEAQAKLVAAVKGTRNKCHVCHDAKAKSKEVRNPFGIVLSTALREQLKMDGDAITAALKSSAPEADQEKVTKAFYECLDKALQKPVDPEKKEAGTYGDRIKNGALPFTQ